MKSILHAVLISILISPAIHIYAQQRDSTLSVFAGVSDDDTWCQATWSYPFFAWEMVFDDGEADDYALWQNPGNINSVKFTPTFYPAYIAGGRIYVGDGSFPGPFLGTHFRVEIYDDDGANGMPGTLLDSMTVPVDNYGWVRFSFMTPLCGIDQGSFYLGMVQTLPASDAAPIGIDTDNPTYSQSYSCFQGNWNVSPYQDFMIRASVTGDSIPEPEVAEYEVARFSNFDPYGSPPEGDTAILDTTYQLFYNDYDWAGLPQGYYAYGVRSHYASGEWSDYFVSNVVGHLITSIHKYQTESFIQVYPNPTQDYMHVSSDLMIRAIRVFDTSGRLILEIFPDSKASVLDLMDLPEGLYLLNVQTDIGYHSEKLIVSN